MSGLHEPIQPLSPIKSLPKQIRVMHPVIVQNVGILIRDHLRLCVTGISLNRFDVAAVQLQLIGDAGMAQTVEDNLWQLVFLNKYEY